MTKDERRLIDQAVREGRVRRFRMGLSGLDPERGRPGRRPHKNAIRLIRALASRGLTDAQIARRIGKTRKAVSNMRYRHNIPAGQPKRAMV